MQSKLKITLGILLKAVLIALLISKMYVPNHSHNYYRFVNGILFSLCIIEVYLTIISINNVGLGIAGILAVLFNPFVKWHLPRHAWDTINISCSFFLLIWIAFDVLFYIGELKYRKKFNRQLSLIDKF